MLRLISRLLALPVIAILGGAVFVTAMALWSSCAPARPVSNDVTRPAAPPPPDRLDPTPSPPSGPGRK